MPPRHKPTKLKIVKGTFEKRHHNPLEPEPASDNLEQPDDLSPEAKKHWDKVIVELESCGILSNLDMTALQIYCEAFASWKHATAQVRKYGTIVTCPRRGYPIRSPYLIVAEKAFEQMTKMLTEFGMTPASRPKVNRIEKKEKTDDPWDSF
jgi:P27 family predicted phage terminase small subunit